MSNTDLPITNLAFYRFVAIDDPEQFAAKVRQNARENGLRGTVLLAPEGLNAMLAGPDEGSEAFVSWLEGDDRFAGLEVKRSYSDRIPFGKLVVKVKPEIVTMRTEGVKATQRTAPHLPPEQLRDWLRRGERIRLIDTRNDYEYRLGTFKGAIDPKTTAFHEFPQWVDEHRDELESEKVVMFCTGGIRCEKATSWMLDQGFDNVWQLEGGVLNYFQRIADAHEDWEGELFVFDDRVAVDTSGRETDATLCTQCGAPICDCNTQRA
jgi:UPF0176 protein